MHDGTAGQWLTESLDDGFRYSIHTHRVLSAASSPFQRVEVHQSDSFGRLLVLDGSFNVSEKDEFFYHENLVHVPACTHPRPATALIIGGGDGGAAEELLKHACIQRVTLVEIDQAVIDVARTYLQAIHRGVISESTGHPKLRVHIADGLSFIKTSTDRYDLIILDLTDPGGPSTPLYTQDFYQACAAKLNSGGLLTLHIASPFAQQDRIAQRVCNRAPVHGDRAAVGWPLDDGLWVEHLGPRSAVRCSRRCKVVFTGHCRPSVLQR